MPLNKYRRIILACSIGVSLLTLVITAIVSYTMQITEPVLQIPYLEMSGPAFLTTIIVVIAFAAIYLFIYQLIDIKKKEEFKNEN